MIRNRPRRPPADETPAQRQAREDREACQNYRMTRSTGRYYRDLGDIDAGSAPKTTTKNEK